MDTRKKYIKTQVENAQINLKEILSIADEGELNYDNLFYIEKVVDRLQENVASLKDFVLKAYDTLEE